MIVFQRVLLVFVAFALLSCGTIPKSKNSAPSRTYVLGKVEIENRDELEYLKLGHPEFLSLRVVSKHLVCIGILISDRLMLTNEHCIGSAQDCASVESATVICERLLLTPRDMDLVVLEVRPRKPTFSSFERVKAAGLDAPARVKRYRHQQNRLRDFELAQSHCLFQPHERDLKFKSYDKINGREVLSIGSTLPAALCDHPGRLGDSGAAILTEDNVLLGIVFGSDVDGDVYYLEGYFIADVLLDLGRL